MELRGKRLTLSIASMEDAEVLLPAFNGDEQFNLWSGLGPAMSLAQVHADIQETQSLPMGTIWRISDNANTLVGVAETAMFPHPHNAWIALLIIRREFQGLGYGSEVVTVLERHLFSYPETTQVGLAVLVKNAPALVFWEKRGYIRVKRTNDQHGNDVYKYSKQNL